MLNARSGIEWSSGLHTLQRKTFPWVSCWHLPSTFRNLTTHIPLKSKLNCCLYHAPLSLQHLPWSPTDICSLHLCKHVLDLSSYTLLGLLPERWFLKIKAFKNGTKQVVAGLWALAVFKNQWSMKLFLSKEYWCKVSLWYLDENMVLKMKQKTIEIREASNEIKTNETFNYQNNRLLIKKAMMKILVMLVT